ncbi:hypothetical protein EV2_041411 [Malus domestica]
MTIVDFLRDGGNKLSGKSSCHIPYYAGSSYRLLRSHHFPKSHLYKTANHTQNPTKFRSTSLTVVSHSSNAHPLDRKSYLACVAPLEAILFDIDGTLCDSDPFHYYAYHEMLQEVGFNGGVPITEAMFRRLVSEKVEPVKGLDSLRQRIEKQGLRRAAVTNASRLNVELLSSKLKLTDFFEILVLGGECVRAKPFPDPYLTAPETLKLSNKHAFIFEV